MRDYRYRAFITYSHTDWRRAEWLQRALEGFTVPRRLVGAPTPYGPTPRKLTPIFRDRSDLAAGGDLTAEIDAAIRDSLFLIVLCSPAAAASKWVEEEVRRFKAYNGEARVLALILDDVPDNASELECFPAALRCHVGSDGVLTDRLIEPLAADLREKRDGEKLALFKIAAGLLGLPLDDLLRRDAQRRARQLQATAAASIGVAVLMGGLALYATDARRDALLQKNEAEGLVEFMLSDLAKKLEPYGRLDALEVVGQRVLAYYQTRDERSLDADALGRRARALIMVGKTDQERNDLTAALAAFETAAGTTAELLRREPNNPQRIFDHAQSVFYVGGVAAARGDLAQAEQHLLEYLRLAERLVGLDGRNLKWRLELAYATSNLGALKYNAGEYMAAISYFERSVAARKALHQTAPDDEEVAIAYAYALSWLASAELTRGGFARVPSVIEEQLSVYGPILRGDPENFPVLDAVVLAKRRLADARLALGQVSEAERVISEAKLAVDRLIARDPNNANWKLSAVQIHKTISLLAGLRGDPRREVEAADRAVALARDIASSDASNINARISYAGALARRVDAGGDDTAQAAAASALDSAYSDLMASDAEAVLRVVGEAGLALARFSAAQGNAAQARDYAVRAFDRLNAHADRLSASAQFSLFLLALQLDDLERSRLLAKKLDGMHFRQPAFLAAKRQLR
jgi:tetratricopeptide (TPR) repeat protein